MELVRIFRGKVVRGRGFREPGEACESGRWSHHLIGDVVGLCLSSGFMYFQTSSRKVWEGGVFALGTQFAPMSPVGFACFIHSQ